ncbi:MAG: ABC transporter ATP-binding protein [Opitutaceae bacterium]|nr:ABC transporter ATP-binding protein [Opitutaceae bacterium]
MRPAVELIGVHQDYRVLGRLTPIHALSDVTLMVAEGEILGVLGPNGSGKSTLLKTVLGLVRPTTGLVRVFGDAADSMASRMAVGFLPDAPVFYRHLSARELLDFYAGLYGLVGRVRRMRVAEVLEEAGVIEAADRRIAGFSKGMLQRLGFAQAILHDPRLLVLDEPGNGLDPEGMDYVTAMLESARSRRRTVLVASHLISQMEHACDRIAIMVDGRLVHVAAVGHLRRGPAECRVSEGGGLSTSCETGRSERSEREGSGSGMDDPETSVGLLAVYRSVVGAARKDRPAA